jgi:asparagine synthase (glutamine-hydrolysing)
MDQPSIDGVNTWFVSKAAKEAGLKVAISGLGSDEILGGYPSFTDIPNWVSKMRLISSLPGLGALGRQLLSWLPSARTNPKLAGLPQYGGSYPGAYLLRRGLFMPWELDEVLGDPAFVAEGMRRLNPLGSLSRTLSPMSRSPISRIAALESCHYMRNQLLRDADWAGMAHSIEIRVPLVDVSFLRSVSSATPHLSGRRGKAALAASPSVPLPTEVANRAKTGFGVPTGAWLARIVGDNGFAKTKGEASRGWAQHVLREQMTTGMAGCLETRAA